MYCYLLEKWAFFFFFISIAPNSGPNSPLHSPRKRGPRLNIRKKSLSLDAPDMVMMAGNTAGNVRQNIPKVVENYCTGESNNHNSATAVASNRPPAYGGTWVNIGQFLYSVTKILEFSYLLMFWFDLEVKDSSNSLSFMVCYVSTLHIIVRYQQLISCLFLYIKTKICIL